MEQTHPDPTAEPRNGRPRLSAFLIYLALALGVLCLLALLGLVAVAEYLPNYRHLTGWGIGSVLVSWAAASAAWIGSINTRPTVTASDRRAALDDAIVQLTAERASLGEAPPAPAGAGPVDFTDEDLAALATLEVPDDLDGAVELEEFARFVGSRGRAARGDGPPSPRPRRRGRRLALVGKGDREQ